MIASPTTEWFSKKAIIFELHLHYFGQGMRNVMHLIKQIIILLEFLDVQCLECHKNKEHVL